MHDNNQTAKQPTKRTRSHSIQITIVNPARRTQSSETPTIMDQTERASVSANKSSEPEPNKQIVGKKRNYDTKTPKTARHSERDRAGTLEWQKGLMK